MSSLLSLAPVLLPHLFTLAMLWRFIFCGTIPRVSPARNYLALYPCRARTFLFIKAISRLSGEINLIIYNLISSQIFLDKRFLLIKRHSKSNRPLTKSCLNLLWKAFVRYSSLLLGLKPFILL